MPGEDARKRLAAVLSLRCILAALILFALCSTARSAVITWTNGVGAWTNAINWSPNQVPGPSDEAVIAVSNVSVTISGTNMVGALIVESNATLVAQGQLNVNTVGGLWLGYGMTLYASNVTVAAGSAISADGQGYQNPSGAGPGGISTDNGASYGGTGYDGPPIYGNYTMPTDLGSSASFGVSSEFVTMDAGGGAIALHVANSLVVNGTISANAVEKGSYYTGAASGGSIFITTSVLNGAGTIAANGALSPSYSWIGGGGGRIAVYYSAPVSSFTNFSNCTANATNAQDGSVVFFDTSVTNLGLAVYRYLTLPAETTNDFGYVTVSGGILTLGGGDVLQVDGALTVQSNGELIAEAINTTAQTNGQWAGAGDTIDASNVTVAAGSAISADGQGYQNPSGAGPGGISTDNGASYGGVGYAGPPAYGNYAMPTDLGSSASYSPGSEFPTLDAGGGAIALHVTNTLNLNGTISANAVEEGNHFTGAASGGSIFITTGVLNGTGTFAANGALSPSYSFIGGGGGRIAVYYSAPASSFTNFVNCTASATNAQNGSVVFFDTSVTNLGLAVYQYLTLPAETTNDFGYVTVSGGTLTLAGGDVLQVDGALTVQSNGELVAEAINNTAQTNGQWAGAGDTIDAGNMTVMAGSAISAAGQGYQNSNGAGPGGTSTGVDGASYGGVGYAGPPTYGNYAMPTDLGSSASFGISSEFFGLDAGGGAIALHVANSLVVNGTISANAVEEGNYYTGAASGGSIFITTSMLNGTGTIAANGGLSPSYSGVGGGGGRIAVYVLSLPNSVTKQLTVTANSGLAGANAGTALLTGYPLFASEVVTNNNMNLTWVAFPQFAYQIQYLSDLRSNNWINLGSTNIVPNYIILNASDAIGTNQLRFYRLFYQ